MSDWIFPSNSDNIFLILTIYLGLPLIIAFVGIIIGSHAKGQIIYHAPDWEYKPFQMDIEEVSKLERRYLREYVRLAPNGYFWLFYAPLLILLGQITLPLYAIQIDTQFIPLVTPIFAFSLSLLFILSTLLGMLATSNAASDDFKVPLIREAVWLCRKQSKIPGVETARVILDKAEIGAYRVYDNPRIFLRLSGLSESAYIETWTHELRAIDSILCRLHSFDETPQIVWWWVARDRMFRKYVGDDNEGYYVKFPVQSNIEEYGVRDIDLLTKNAVAILYREWFKTHERDSAIADILNQLNAKLE